LICVYLGGPAPGSGGLVSSEEHLHRGLRRHDGGDVAPLDDDAAVADQAPLQRNHRRADGWHCAHRAHRRGDAVLPDRRAHVGAVDGDARPVGVRADLELDVGDDSLDSDRVAGVDATLEDRPGRGAVHRSGVQIAQAEPVADGSGDG
jgi:hypothetical protein